MVFLGTPNSNSIRIGERHESELSLMWYLSNCYNLFFVSILFPGSVGGGVSSGEMNRTIQQFLESFAQDTFGKPRDFSIVLHWFLFYGVEGILRLCMILFTT